MLFRSALDAWLRAHGGRVGSLGVGADGARGRGAFAIADVDDGEELVQVPWRCILAAGELDDPLSRRLRAGWLGPSQEHVVLTVALLRARVDRDPFWAPYLRSLPAAVPGHPTSWDDEAVADFAGTTFGRLLAERRELFDQELGFVTATCPPLADLPEETWRLARTLVGSRAFSLTIRGVEQSALVPFADLLNHGWPPQTRWGSDDEGFYVRARGAIPVGAAVQNSYGARSNSRLLLHYGFTLPDNPLQETFIDLGALGRHRVSPTWDEHAARLFSEARGALATLEERALRGGETTRPLSVRNESLTLLMIAREARRARTALPAPTPHTAAVVTDEARVLDWLGGLGALVPVVQGTGPADDDRPELAPYAGYLRFLRSSG